ncbi:MAG: ATP-binding protein [Candidatus Omnitrophica bacterium]|nr:ATP-binding protein [Candidatus Omnitrophota bacterium]
MDHKGLPLEKSAIEHFVSKRAGTAINRFGMIKDGDKILVGVSGGKDSLTLLKVLKERQRWVPVKYAIKAIHVISDYEKDPGEKKMKLTSFFEEIGCDHVFKEVAISGKRNKRGREDCFWCAWNRRKAIFQACAEMGFGKVAFGHHKDDVVETILMNMIYNGEISSMNPVQPLFEGEVTLIRPLVLVEEKEIAKYAREAQLPVIRSTCPRSGDSRRALVKDIVSRLSREKQDVKSNIVRAPSRVKGEYITDMTERA